MLSVVYSRCTSILVPRTAKKSYYRNENFFSIKAHYLQSCTRWQVPHGPARPAAASHHPRSLFPAGCSLLRAQARTAGTGKAALAAVAEGRPPAPHGVRHGGVSGKRAAGAKPRVGRTRPAPRVSRPSGAAPSRPRGAAGGARAAARPGPARRGGRGSTSADGGAPLPAAAAAGTHGDPSEPEPGGVESAARRRSRGCGRCHRPLLSRRRSPRGGSSGTRRPSAPGSRKRRSAGAQRPPPSPPSAERAPAARAVAGAASAGVGCLRYAIPVLPRPGLRGEHGRLAGSGGRSFVSQVGAGLRRGGAGWSGRAAGPCPSPPGGLEQAGTPPWPACLRGRGHGGRGTCLCRSDPRTPAGKLEEPFRSQTGWAARWGGGSAASAAGRGTPSEPPVRGPLERPWPEKFLPRQRFAAALDYLSLRSGAENRSEIMSRLSPPRSVRGPAVVLGAAGGEGAFPSFFSWEIRDPRRVWNRDEEARRGRYLFIYFKCRFLLAV